MLPALSYWAVRVPVREPVVIERAREHPKFRYFPETGEERFESLMAVPLIVRGVPIGVLAVQTKAPRSFPPRDVQSFQTCAQLIAPVVMNARLLSIVDQSEEERERIGSQLATSGLPMRGHTAARERQVIVVTQETLTLDALGVTPDVLLEAGVTRSAPPADTSPSVPVP